MKKLLKILGCIILGIVALALVLVLTLPLWLGPVVKPSANAIVPKLTKTSFNLGHLYLNPYTGRFELGDMQLGNPQGYSEQYAVTASNIVIDVAMSTLGDKYIHIEEVTVAGVFVSYQDGGEHGVDNFTQIQYNVAGGKEKYEAAQAKAAGITASQIPPLGGRGRWRLRLGRGSHDNRCSGQPVLLGSSCPSCLLFLPPPLLISQGGGGHKVR